MGFLLLCHSVKRYKKGISDKFVEVLSRPIVCITIFLKHHFVLHESYVQKIHLSRCMFKLESKESSGGICLPFAS